MNMATIRRTRAAQRGRVDGWQPIATAPVGMNVFVYVPGKFPQVFRWHVERVRQVFKDSEWPTGSTHWMHIPELPK